MASYYQALWGEGPGIAFELLESLSAEDIKASCGRRESHTASPSSLLPVPATPQLRAPCVSCPLPFVASFHTAASPSLPEPDILLSSAI